MAWHLFNSLRTFFINLVYCIRCLYVRIQVIISIKVNPFVKFIKKGFLKNSKLLNVLNHFVRFTEIPLYQRLFLINLR